MYTLSRDVYKPFVLMERISFMERECEEDMEQNKWKVKKITHKN